MAVNDRTPMLEPAGSNGRDGMATLYSILGVLFWIVGAALTALAVLAFLDIGKFPDFFNTVLEDEVTIVTIILFGLGTFFGGLFLLTIGKFIRILKRISTTTYQIRGLDAVIPKTIAVAGKEESKDRSSSKEKPAHEDHSRGMTKAAHTLEGTGVSITFNVQGALPEGVPSTSTAPVPVPAEDDED